MTAMLRIDYEDGHEVFVDMKVHLVRYRVEWPQYYTVVVKRWSTQYPFFHKKEELRLSKGYIAYYFSNGDRREVSYTKREALIKAIEAVENALQTESDDVIHAHEANVSHSSTDTTHP